MKCLILAAGAGSRLKQKVDSKPLLKLLGLTLIERTLLTAAQAGIDEFYVVTGYHNEKLSSFLAQFSKQNQIKITTLNNKDWEKGNGTSVFQAKNHLNEAFMLVMADHLFLPDTFKKLMSQPIQKDEVILAVDTKIQSNKLIDINDVTKVFQNNNKMIDIGKEITKYNAFDTGMFLCTPAIFTTIEKSMSLNDFSLSGGIKLLAQQGKMICFDTTGDFWLDIDDECAVKKANKYLLQNLTKTADGPVSRYLNRPLSTRITKLIINTNISPNQISVFCFTLAIAASLLFISGNPIYLIIGGCLAQASSIIDGCDGEIARLKFIGTKYGGWLDSVLDRYADGLLIMGLTYYLFQLSENHGFVILIGFLALIGSFLNSYTAGKYDDFMKTRTMHSRWTIRIGRDIRTFIIFVGAVLNYPLSVLIILATITNIENFRRILLLYKDE